MNTRDAAYVAFYELALKSVRIGDQQHTWEYFELIQEDTANEIEELLKGDIQRSVICSECLAGRFQELED
jgi:hypothetical protein|tara:strand:+ start:1424 stop:1633 length:210 start_codon:yes stop_codon:yes gene_type:complete